jgi:hypothetical protein
LIGSQYSTCIGVLIHNENSEIIAHSSKEQYSESI